MNRIIATFCLLMGFSLAYAEQAKPVICPSINAIKGALFFIQKDFTTHDGRTFFTASQEDQKYDTNWQDLWHFEIFDIEASSIEDARNKLNVALSTFSLKTGPYQMGNLGWYCDYNMDFGFKASATTDLVDGMRHQHH